MAESIKGLTVKIGADTSDFVKGLKKVDKEINATAKTAQELEKSLRLDYDEQRFIQAQKKAQQALDTTNEKAEAIRKQLKYLEESGNVDTEGYRKLETELAKTEANALKLKQRLEEIEKIKIENATKKISALGSGLEKAGAATRALSAAAVGAAVGIAKLAKDSVDAADNIATLAKNYGMSTEAIQRWDYVARQSDVESETLYKSFQKLNVALGDQLTGKTSTATKALEQLNIKASDFDSADEAFSVLIGRISELGSVAEKTSIAGDIFGDRYASTLISLFDQGADAIEKYNKEFESIGFIGEDSVTKGADFDNELRQVTQSFANAKIELGIELIPVLRDFSEILKNTIVPMIKRVNEYLDGMSESSRKTAEKTVLLVAVLSPLLTMLGKFVSAIPKIIKLMSGLNVETVKSVAAWGGLLISIGAVIGVLANWDNMSGIQKVIGLIGALTAAVLSAAVAFGVFHSAWSIGLATAGIVAGIAASIAAINEAKKNIDVPANIPDYNVNDYTSAVTGGTPTTSAGAAGSYTEDNSQYNINVEMNTTGELNYDAKQLADEVIRQIVIKKQAAGG